jgi:hypothetical protein
MRKTLADDNVVKSMEFLVSIFLITLAVAGNVLKKSLPEIP